MSSSQWLSVYLPTFLVAAAALNPILAFINAANKNIVSYFALATGLTAAGALGWLF